MSVFGPIVTATAVERGALDVLRTWVAHYVAEVERQLDPDEEPCLPAPRSYSVWSERDKWPEHQTPAVIVVSPGLASEPVRRAGAGYAAAWRVSVGVVVSARDEVSTRRLAGVYAAAARAAMVQHPSLGGVAEAVVWVGEEYLIAPDSGRTWGIGISDFDVSVAGVTDPAGGPLVMPDPAPPAPEPWPEPPTIADIDGLTVTHREDA